MLIISLMMLFEVYQEEIPGNTIDDKCDGLDGLSGIQMIEDVEIKLYRYPVTDKLFIKNLWLD